MNPHTHYYLYAKGKYKKTDLLLDLSTITSHYANINIKHVTLNDVRVVLTSVLVKEIGRGNMEYTFPKFINDLFRNLGNREMITHEAVFGAMLSVLAVSLVKDLDLGEADPNILPLTKE